ncbi:kinase-like domain-containing protein [Aspergillus pseudonomiae]|uniref:Kinase-like domain-containing protein n=1 Tax=Aspergillus pseudonomiae TaxID=1506151 RepID=A0A5N6HMC8_9EURO|nr:kinase-like domain-containing protein [Aspergillus pseudonomiae]KAB8255641.1 kinase-like domain-containing protein [Aspergillus pseudonomiae]KAE8406437.1 kinase-like domain-containing protein [Aspergillus pseudonomiae]
MSDGEDDMATFQQVLNHLDLAKIPPFVLSIRQQGENAEDGTSTCTSCSVLPERFFGSNNILFPLEFNTGERWTLKIPVHGYPGGFNHMYARVLTTEASTMQFLRRKTTIPIPTVFSFSATLDNDLGCPYILMEYIDGKSTRHVWFNEELDAATLERHRTQVLLDLSKIMLQLNQFTFSEAGSPIFDNSNNPIGVGPLRVMDMPATLKELRKNDICDTVIQSEIEPSSDPKAWMLCMFERHEPPDDKFSQGAHRLLKHFIEWLPWSEFTKEPFVLTHPDFNFQNILVSDEGKVCALIDWEGVSTVPRFLGNERYPSWLTRDWDPMNYGYGVEECFVQENLPEELSHYRQLYRGMIQAAVTEDQKETDASAVALSKRNLERHLLVLESLSIAADQPINLPEIVQKLFNEVSKQDGFPEDLELWEVCFGLADEDLDDEQLESVRCGFQKLLQSPH